MKRWIIVVVLLLLGSWPRAIPGLSHEGPPFPLLENEVVGPYIVSVWTDPDIGIGRFFVILEAPEGQTDFSEPTLVEVRVRPVSGRLDEVVYRAEPERSRVGARYYTEVEFDQGEMWHIQVRIESPQGGGTLEAEVEATPDGSIGPIGLFLYTLPFLAIGLLWLKAFLSRRKQEQQAAASEE